MIQLMHVLITWNSSQNLDSKQQENIDVTYNEFYDKIEMTARNLFELQASL